MNDVAPLVVASYGNRCPLLARLPHVPSSEVEFGMCTHRYMTKEEKLEYSGRGDGTLVSTGISDKQWCQHFEKDVTPDRSETTPHPMEFPNAHEFHKSMQLQNLCDEIEEAFYRGIGMASDVSRGVKAHTKGLASILKRNMTSVPVNADAYEWIDLVRDTIHACDVGGGLCDRVYFSTNFFTVFSVWGLGLARANDGMGDLGIPSMAYEVYREDDCERARPLAPGVKFVHAPLLPDFTAFALTSSEVCVRTLVPPSWVAMGDGGRWVADVAIEVSNENHHAWLEGIKRFC